MQPTQKQVVIPSIDPVQRDAEFGHQRFHVELEEVDPLLRYLNTQPARLASVPRTIEDTSIGARDSLRDVCQFRERKTVAGAPLLREAIAKELGELERRL